MRLLSSFGQLPNTWINIFITVISGMVEGFGLALFIPLLQIMNGNGLDQLPKPFSYIVTAMERIGLSVNTMTILVLIVVFSLSALALSYLQRRMMIHAKNYYTRSLRNKLFGLILCSSWGKSSERSHGEVINLLTVECNRYGIALGFELMAVATGVQIVLYLVFSTVIAWQLIVVVTILGSLMYLATRPFNRRAKELGQQATQANRNFSFYSLEYLRSLKLLKATANEWLAKRDISQRVEDLFSFAFKSELNGAQLNILMQALPVLVSALIIWLANEVMHIPVPVMLVFLLFIIRIAPRVAQLQQFVHSYNLHSPAIQVVNAAMDENQAAEEIMNRDGLIFNRIEQQISLKDVVFEYPGGETPALNSVSMEIGRNQMVAIVGGSGAGKSTVMDILTGLRRADTGQVAIDGIDLRDFNLETWRRKIGMVTQDTVTFNASLRDNLSMFTPDATEDDLNRALAIARLDDLVETLPDGLETNLGESGVRFSGGQLQRIALARALVGKPELLLLDEATSALDNESERYVQDAITALACSMTIVIIAHRLSTVRRADKIFVMEKGIIVEHGTYDELMTKGGRFADLREIELF